VTVNVSSKKTSSGLSQQLIPDPVRATEETDAAKVQVSRSLLALNFGSWTIQVTGESV